MAKNYVQIAYVLQVAERNSCMCWKLSAEDGEVIDQQQDESVSITESLQALQAAHNSVAGEYVTVLISTRKLVGRAPGGDMKTGIFKYNVYCVTPAPNSIKTASQFGGGFNAMHNQQFGMFNELMQLNVAMAEMRKQQEIEALQRELKEAKKGKKGKNKYLKVLLKSMFPEIAKTEGQPAIAGTKEAPADTQQATPGKTEEQRKNEMHKLAGAIKELNSDGNATELLDKLARMKKEKPEQYETYLKMFMNL